MAQTATQNLRTTASDTQLDVELQNIFNNGQPAVHGVDLDIRSGSFFRVPPVVADNHAALNCWV